jgi:hypothetical protein
LVRKYEDISTHIPQMWLGFSYQLWKLGAKTLLGWNYAVLALQEPVKFT